MLTEEGQFKKKKKVSVIHHFIKLKKKGVPRDNHYDADSYSFSRSRLFVRTRRHLMQKRLLMTLQTFDLREM